MWIFSRRTPNRKISISAHPLARYNIELCVSESFLRFSYAETSGRIWRPNASPTLEKLLLLPTIIPTSAASIAGKSVRLSPTYTVKDLLRECASFLHLATAASCANAASSRKRWSLPDDPRTEIATLPVDTPWSSYTISFADTATGEPPEVEKH